MRQEMMRFWDVVASAGLYANNLHLLQTDNHTNTSSLNFYRPVVLPDPRPTVSKHWRQIHDRFKYKRCWISDWSYICMCSQTHRVTLVTTMIIMLMVQWWCWNDAVLQVNEKVSSWKSQTDNWHTSNKTQVAEYKSSFRKAQFFFFPGIVEWRNSSGTWCGRQP